jgi:hypothetical protein
LTRSVVVMSVSPKRYFVSPIVEAVSRGASSRASSVADRTQPPKGS